MLEAVASPAYKELLDALGKLADWTEQAGNGGLPSGPPSPDLVRQFNEALASVPVDAVQPANATDAVENAVRPIDTGKGVESAPPDVIGDSAMFRTDGKDIGAAGNTLSAEKRFFEPPRREVDAMTGAQEVNMERGLDALDAVTDGRRREFLEAARDLSQLLSRPAEEISPMNLLQAQRLVGILKVHAESGKKVSEGVSDTLEQLLEQQG